MSTGDIQNNFEKLRRLLIKVKYKPYFDANRVMQGETSELLPMLHYVLLDCSRLVARFLVEKGHDLYAKNDLRFVDGVFKIARNIFNYVPKITPAQFLGKGFAERKLLLLCDIITLCMSKHNELCKKNKAKRRPGARSSSVNASTASSLSKAVSRPKPNPSASVANTPATVTTQSSNQASQLGQKRTRDATEAAAAHVTAPRPANPNNNLSRFGPTPVRAFKPTSGGNFILNNSPAPRGEPLATPIPILAGTTPGFTRTPTTESFGFLNTPGPSSEQNFSQIAAQNIQNTPLGNQYSVSKPLRAHVEASPIPHVNSNDNNSVGGGSSDEVTQALGQIQHRLSDIAQRTMDAHEKLQVGY